MNAQTDEEIETKEVAEEDITEINAEESTEAEANDNDVIKTNIPNLHFPDEFYESKDTMGDTKEFNFEMNLESMLSNAFESETSDEEPIIDFAGLDEIPVFDSNNESGFEEIVIEPKTEQEVQFDIYASDDSDDSDDTDDNDGELGFITDLD